MVDLYTILQDEFTTQEQQMFIANFQCYSKYDAEADYVIDLDRVFEHAGFTSKAHAVRLLKSHFVEGTDFNLQTKGNFLLTFEGEQSTTNEVEDKRGGHNKQQILMTPNTFKDLCIRANTTKGKEIRKYYIKMERIVHRYLDEQKNAEIQAARQEAENVKALLASTQAELNSRMNKYFKGSMATGTVYIQSNSDHPGDNKYTVGKTGNVSKREDQYRGHSEGRMMFAVKCKNENLLEKLVQFALSEWRIDSRREWFDAPFEVIKNTLQTCQIFMDGLVGCTENALALNSCDKMQELMDNLHQHEETQEYHDDASVSECTTLAPDDGDDVHADIIVSGLTNPTDYAAFLSDCCIVGEGLTAGNAQMKAMYRLWSRTNTRAYNNGFYKYIKSKFKSRPMHDEETGSRLSRYIGISLHPYVPAIPNEFMRPQFEDISAFVDEKLTILVTGRTTCQDLRDAFASWKNEKGNAYQMTPAEKKRLDEYFSSRFLCASVYDGKWALDGYFGFVLKDSTSQNIGLKLNDKLMKTVCKIDPVTNTIVQTYKSLTEASNVLKVGASRLSQDMRYNRPRAGFHWKYECDLEAE